MSARADTQSSVAAATKLSYKFQRLREQLRQAILQGEFEGQLPGERELGRRFRANAKTINKALCDLAGDGLVKRFIGRGTFVAYALGSHVSMPQRRVVHWLSAASTESGTAAIRELLTAALADRGDRLESDFARPTRDGRLDVDPGFFRADRHVDALVIAALSPLSNPADNRPGENLLVSLARRQVPTMLFGSVCDAMKRHAVLPDYVAGGFRLTEHLFDLGTREVVAAIVSDDGPEIRAALHGYETSCRRRHRAPIILNVETGATSVPGVNGRSNDDSGLLCIGGAALDRVMSIPKDQRHKAHTVAVLEPGDDAGRRHEITSYEFDPRRLIDWVARLIVECGRGTPPIEVLVPGSLHFRSARSSSVQRDALAEVVI